jgi:hypothetical protein
MTLKDSATTAVQLGHCPRHRREVKKLALSTRTSGPARRCDGAEHVPHSYPERVTR